MSVSSPARKWNSHHHRKPQTSNPNWAISSTSVLLKLVAVGLKVTSAEQWHYLFLYQNDRRVWEIFQLWGAFVIPAGCWVHVCDISILSSTTRHNIQTKRVHLFVHVVCLYDLTAEFTVKHFLEARINKVIVFEQKVTFHLYVCVWEGKNNLQVSFQLVPGRSAAGDYSKKLKNCSDALTLFTFWWFLKKKLNFFWRRTC